MDILFESDKIAREFNTGKLLVKSHGPLRTKKIKNRMAQIRAAECLEDMRALPGRCHELKGDRAGQLSLDLDHPIA